ncbi:MAG: hypothetical protein FWH24_02755, partial [Oscillospiraceae bacterium]|nr:hypothetical protein [Oscillospiraceae bacterium]
ACLPGEYILNISCSKGTYIRSICHDIGELLGCGGIMAALCRTNSGMFDIERAYKPEYVQSLERPETVLIPCGEILQRFAGKKIELDAFYSRLAKNGAEIYLKKLNADSDFTPGEKILMYDDRAELFALGEIKDYTEGRACKAQIFI